MRLLAFLLMGLAATAAYTQPLISIYGIGDQSCGRFIQSTKDSKPDIAYRQGSGIVLSESTVFMQWARGFVSAVNTTLSKAGDKRSMRAIDHAAMLTWLENYCRKDPEKLWYEAVHDYTFR